MNNSIAVPNQGPWPLSPYAPGQPQPLVPGRRIYSAASILDLPTFLRIVHHWRWLILGLVAIGLAAGTIMTLLTTPVYRASVTLEVNPPTVEVTSNQSKEQDAYQNPYDIVATQVGLLTSKAVAERTAQELNLGNNPDFVRQTGDASVRLRSAASKVQAGPPNSLSQLLGGPPSPRGSRQTYQSRFALLRDERLSTNHGCWSEVWFGTKSRMMRRPLPCAAATSRSKSASDPKIGSIAQ